MRKLLLVVGIYLVGDFSYAAPRPKPLLLISIDGFKADYLSATDTPVLWKFAQEGTRAASLKPSYPSQTFPNHYSIVTGLYPEHHGIVANEFRDPISGLHFKLSDREHLNDTHWWLGEPIWVTAQRQGLKSGTLFWPGSEAKINDTLPTYFRKYDMGLANDERVAQLLKWFALPEGERPQFFTLYFDTVDTAGHRYGPGSPELVGALREVDRSLGILFKDLAEQKLYDQTNILVVSDHGMLRLDPAKAVNVSEVVAHFPKVDRVGSTTLALFYSKDATEIEKLKIALEAKSKLYSVYRQKEIPPRFHYTEGNRTPSLLLVASEGASVDLNPSFLPEKTGAAPYVATHGYDNSLPSMQAIFLARGPDILKAHRVASFENIQIYNLMCKLLHIKPAPNDGSRLAAPTVLKRVK